MVSFSTRIPAGDTHERQVCDTCGWVAYENPKIVTGSVVVVDGQVLLCRRAIEPRRGYWTLPAGYMELNETADEGAKREAWEEARARIALDGILAVYSIARIGQVQILFRARFDGPVAFSAGEESMDVRLFSAADIPWGDLAFPTVRWALQAWQRTGTAPLGAPDTNPSHDPRGLSPEVPAGAAA